MTHLLVQQPNNKVHLTVLSGEMSLTDYAAKFLVGKVYETIADTNTLPHLDYFDAWRWAGAGQSVSVDTTNAKEIANDLVRNHTLQAVKHATQLEALGESANYTSTNIKSAYTTVKSTISSAADYDAVKTAVDNFRATHPIPVST
jgi:hypothetical protein